MKKIHVLPGDALIGNFKHAGIEGEIAICRECLIEGEVKSANLDDFWTVRARFINSTYGGETKDYRQNVVDEFEKLENLAKDSEVNLWFEYDLFCQVNLWFCLSLLDESEAEIYRIAPKVRNERDTWKGFGKLNAEALRQCFQERILFNKNDILLGKNLWRAFQNQDFAKLKSLGETKSECFPKLKEVCDAEIEKQFRPLNALQEIISEGATDFAGIFEQFSKKEPVYGYGDSQVKNIYNRLEK